MMRRMSARTALTLASLLAACAPPSGPASGPETRDAAPGVDARPDGGGVEAPRTPFVRVPLHDAPQWRSDYPPRCTLGHIAACNAQLFTGGVAVRDLDGDGLEDVYLTRHDAPDLVLFNTPGGWTERTVPGLDADLPSNGAAFADIDGDGDPDLLVGTVGGDRFHLFINDGRGGFEERAASRGAAQLDERWIHATMSLCFGDVDLDGHLDLYTTEWRAPRRDLVRSHNALLLNRGARAPGYFDDVTEAYGVDILDVARGGAWGFTAHFADLDADRYPELIVTADYGSSRLFWSADGTDLVDGTEAAGVGTDENGMGSALGDYDGDGDLDLFVGSIYDDDCAAEGDCFWGHTGNRLYRNDGDRRFTDVAVEAGVADGGWGWGARFFDFDHDGDLDLVQANGTMGTPEETGFHDENVRLFRNDGGRFVDVAEALGLVDRGMSRAVVTFDYDLDGDLDLLFTHNRAAPQLWRNDATEGRSWLVVRPVGSHENRDGVGAVVRVWTDLAAPPQLRVAGNGCGFLGHTDGRPHFGLGDVERLPRVEVFWPRTGRTTALEDVPARQVLVVTEPE